MTQKKPIAVIWLFPSRGTLVTNVPSDKPPKGNPLPLEAGTVLRTSDMIGTVLEDRTLDGVPLAARSVAVRCTYSLGRFPELDKEKINVWSVLTSQVLSGRLLEEAESDPEPFLRKFMALEAKLQEQENVARAKERAAKLAEAKQQDAKPKKRPPGKQKGKTK